MTARLVRRRGRRPVVLGALVALGCAAGTARPGYAAEPAKPATGPAASRPAAPAAAKSPAEIRPTTRVLDCLAGGCHARQKDHKFLHGPVAVGACQMCHLYADEKKHTFQPRRKREQMCNFCHIGRAEGKYIHKPVLQGECLGCHDPHGSANRELLRKADMGQMCSSCHDKVMRGRKYAHGPVATGACGACHRSHTSEHPKLLVAEGQRLCLDCHQQFNVQITAARYIHKPLEGPCLQCHEAHGSNHPRQIRDEPARLCLSCHDHKKMEQLVLSAPEKHTAVTEGQACMNCHTPHGGELDHLQKDLPVVTCQGCHSKPVSSPDNTRTVPAMPDMTDPRLNKHGAVRNGTCSGCHEVHGGKVFALLSAPYSKDFYTSFDAGKYALCFSCHTDQLALAEKTTAVTGFRNGSQNLHYLHVNKAKRGRTCRACHSTHVSPNPMHIAETVPFGNWKMPINFKPTATGGSCAPGCHKPLAYDRVTPVKPKQPASARAAGGKTRTPATAAAKEP